MNQAALVSLCSAQLIHFPSVGRVGSYFPQFSSFWLPDSQFSRGRVPVVVVVLRAALFIPRAWVCMYIFV